MPWFGTKACKKKKLISLSWLRNLKNKNYPWWRIDTYFSNTKRTNVQIVTDGGWHFTNLKTAEEIHKKLSNFGHHNEYDESGLNVKDIQFCIDNRIVNYNHLADKSDSNKYTAEYKLKLVNDEILPKFLVENKIQIVKQEEFNHAILVDGLMHGKRIRALQSNHGILLCGQQFEALEEEELERKYQRALQIIERITVMGCSSQDNLPYFKAKNVVVL